MHKPEQSGRWVVPWLDTQELKKTTDSQDSEAPMRVLVNKVPQTLLEVSLASNWQGSCSICEVERDQSLVSLLSSTTNVRTEVVFSEHMMTDALPIILIAVDIGKICKYAFVNNKTFKYLTLFIIL